MSGGRRLWFQLPKAAWVAIAAAVPVVGGLVGIWKAFDTTEVATAATIEEPIAWSAASYGDYLADLGASSAGIPSEELAIAGQEFRLKVDLTGAADKTMYVAQGIYTAPGCQRLAFKGSLLGRRFTPADQASIVILMWASTSVKPPDRYCVKFSVGRLEQEPLDYVDHVFRSATAVPAMTQVEVDQPTQAAPLLVLAPSGAPAPPPITATPTITAATGPTPTGPTPTTTSPGPTPPPEFVVIPTEPLAARQIPRSLSTVRPRAGSGGAVTGTTTSGTPTTTTTTAGTTPVATGTSPAE